MTRLQRKRQELLDLCVTDSQDKEDITAALDDLCDEVFSDGYDQGYSEGEDAGYSKGYDACEAEQRENEDFDDPDVEDVPE